MQYDDFVISALLEEAVVSREEVDRAGRHASQNQMSLAEALVSLGSVRAREVAIMRASISEVPFIDVTGYEIDIRNASLIPRSVAQRHTAFPLFDLGSVVTVGMADPLDLRAVDQLRALIKQDIEPVLCEPEALQGLIGRAYSLAGGTSGGRPEDAGRFEQADLTTGEEPIVAAVNQILAGAIDEGASDVHIGPDEQQLHLRYRIDGTLHARQGPSLSAHPGVVQRIKVMANLDLTQTRRPQDGKFRYAHKGRAVDVRVSIIPTVCGENVVMRLLASSASIKGFSELGFPQEERLALEELVTHPYGMILVTGPTGSGKTTTLYTAIQSINAPDKNILTIEDPVEIRLPLVRQVQVNPEIGMTFAGALRSILRQDPDCVLVGEIRDEETARIALQAALTGHLVLSTLHTNDAAGAIARLRDFHCPAFAINAALLCVIAQRLIRRVCPECAEPATCEPALAHRFGIRTNELGLVKGRGCPRCSNMGYRGRLGVFELMRMTLDVQRAVEGEGSTEAVRRAALRSGMKPMWRDGLEKARIGITTVEEVARVVAVGLADHREELRMSA